MGQGRPRSSPLQDHLILIKEAVEGGGAGPVVEYISGQQDRLRRILFVMARQVLALQDWEGKNFDDYIAVCDAGVADLLREADASVEDDERANCMRAAHALSYNLAADLAECWPGDDAPRSREHLERGLKAADDCVTWAALASNDAALANDHWAKGMHQLSLGDTELAIESWEKALDYGVKAADASGKPTAVNADGAFGVVLGTGYLGLARWVHGQAAGQGQYEDAIAAFNSQLDDPDKEGNAQLGIGQLEKVKDKFIR